MTTEATAIVTADAENARPISAFSSASNFDTAQRMAKALAHSSLVPEAYRGNIPNILIALEQASRIGASVFAVMQNLDIIHGKPSFRSSFLIATVNACGRFTPLRFRFQGEEGSTTWGVRAVAKDVASGEECIGSLITIEMAIAEGWVDRKGSKWKTMPEQMLVYRAAAFWTRMYAPELSLGMRSTDENEDIGGAPALPTGPLPAGLVPGNTQELEAALRGESAQVPVAASSAPAMPIPPSEVA